jgi:hypothetical protein
MGWKILVDEWKVRERAMQGKTAEVVARMKSFVPPCSSSHCEFHRQAIVKMKETSLKSVLKETVKTVNYVSP